MRFRPILAATLVATLAAGSAAARDHGRHFPTLRAAIDAGCTVQQVHTPAGKPVATPPIVRCTPAQIAAAKAERVAERAAD